MTRHLLTTATLLAAILLPASISNASRHKKHQSQPADTASATSNAGAIHGTVRAGSKGVCHIAVRLLNRHHTPAHTSKTGEFTFQDLRPGVYTLVAHTKHQGSARVKLAVDAGKTTELVLPLHTHHWLRPGGVATPGHTPRA